MVEWTGFDFNDRNFGISRQSEQSLSWEIVSIKTLIFGTRFQLIKAKEFLADGVNRTCLSSEAWLPTSWVFVYD